MRGYDAPGVKVVNGKTQMAETLSSPQGSRDMEVECSNRI